MSELNSLLNSLMFAVNEARQRPNAECLWRSEKVFIFVKTEREQQNKIS